MSSTYAKQNLHKRPFRGGKGEKGGDRGGGREGEQEGEGEGNGPSPSWPSR